jgi:hypothetical protein
MTTTGDFLASGVQVGDRVEHAGVPASTNVLAVTSGSLQMSNNASSTAGPSNATFRPRGSRWNHTIPSGDDRILLIKVITQSAQSVSSVTRDSQSGIFVGSVSNDIGDFVKVEMWAILGPTVGTSEVAVAMTNNVNTGIICEGNSYANVYQGSPFGAVFTSADFGPSILSNVLNTNGDGKVVDVIGENPQLAITVGSGQTVRSGPNNTTNIRSYSSDEDGTGGTVDMEWSVDGGLDTSWAQIAVELQPVPPPFFYVEDRHLKSLGGFLPDPPPLQRRVMAPQAEEVKTPFRRPWMQAILNSWLPAPPAQQFRPRTIVSVDPPPVSDRGWLVAVLEAWRPAPDVQTKQKKLVPIEVAQVPYTRPWLSRVARSWEPEPQPVIRKRFVGYGTSCDIAIVSDVANNWAGPYTTLGGIPILNTPSSVVLSSDDGVASYMAIQSAPGNGTNPQINGLNQPIYGGRLYGVKVKAFTLSAPLDSGTLIIHLVIADGTKYRSETINLTGLTSTPTEFLILVDTGGTPFGTGTPNTIHLEAAAGGAGKYCCVTYVLVDQCFTPPFRQPRLHDIVQLWEPGPQALARRVFAPQEAAVAADKTPFSRAWLIRVIESWDLPGVFRQRRVTKPEEAFPVPTPPATAEVCYPRTDTPATAFSRISAGSTVFSRAAGVTAFNRIGAGAFSGSRLPGPSDTFGRMEPPDCPIPTGWGDDYGINYGGSA